MRVLVVAPQPFFSPRGTPMSVYYRTMVLSELGAEIDFLTYGEGQDVDIPGVKIIRTPRFSFVGNVKIGPSPLKLFLDLFILLRFTILLLRNKYNFVHAHEEAVFFAIFLKPIFRFKLVYDMHSSLPQQLSNFNFTTSRLLIKLFTKLELAGINAADAIITICPDLFNYVKSIIKENEKVLLIENSIFDPVKIVLKNNSESKLTNTGFENLMIHRNGNKLLVYAGTLEKYQGIDILIKSFKYVINKEPSCVLVLVGGTNEQVNYYRNIAEECGIADKVIFTGSVPQKQAKIYTDIADLLLSPRSSGTNTPLKIYEQLASGKPLVATNIYSHTQVLNEDVAFLVKPEPKDMAKGILKALKSKSESRIKANNAKTLYEKYYSRSMYKKKLIKLLEILI